MKELFLHVKGVSKFFYKKKQIIKKALENVSLDLYKGEILGLLGVNGAGKTTLVSIFATLHPPTRGDILWNDKSIYKDLLHFRSKVGFCPQNANIEKKISLGESLVFFARCYGFSKAEAISRRDELVKQFGLEEYINSYVDQVSGGYRQRFLIARSLMHKPQLVLLDEPTVGLDSHVRRELWDLIIKLRNQNITVILTTHYLDEVEYLSDRICFIHDGTIRTIDTLSNLKKQYKKDTLEQVFLEFVNHPDAKNLIKREKDEKNW